MIVIRGRVLRIFPDEEQTEKIEQNFGACRFIYNKYVDKYAKSADNLRLFDAIKELTALKKTLGYDWLKSADAVALQETVKDFKTAFDRYKQGISGRPKRKCKSTPVQSYRTNNNNFSVKFFTDNIQLPKLGRVNCAGYDNIRGEIISATIKRKYDKYYCILCVREAIDNSNIADNTYNEIIIENYELPETILRKRKICGCKNMDLRNRRKNNYSAALNDWLQKLSTDICRENRFIKIREFDAEDSQDKLTIGEYHNLIRMIEYKAPIYKCDIIRQR